MASVMDQNRDWFNRERGRSHPVFKSTRTGHLTMSAGIEGFYTVRIQSVRHALASTRDSTTFSPVRLRSKPLDWWLESTPPAFRQTMSGALCPSES